MLPLLLAAALAAPPTVGELFPDFEARALVGGSEVVVPDPGGDFVVVELIRSVDW